MFDELNSIVSGQELLRQQMRAVAQSQIKPAIQTAVLSLLAQVPEIEAVAWRQFTPGFNDGEPCEFTIRALDVKWVEYDPEQEDGDFEDGFESDWSYGSRGKSLRTPAKDLLNKFESIIHNLHDLLEFPFGNGSRVICSKDGITVEEYYCEY